MDDTARETIIRNQIPSVAILDFLDDRYDAIATIVPLTFPIYCTKLQSALNEVLGGNAPHITTMERAQGRRGFKGKILVAEDNLANQELIKIILERYGLEYTIASNGEEALECYRSDRFDMVLMDEQMPHMNGNEATERILAFEQARGMEHTPIAAVTANVMKGSRERSIQNGYDAFLGKPIVLKEIEQLFERYLTPVVLPFGEPTEEIASKWGNIDMHHLKSALMLEEDQIEITIMPTKDKELLAGLRALEGLDLELIQADLRDRASLVRAFDGVELVYHLAASISLRMDSWETVAAVNLEGTRNVLEACQHSGVRRLIYFSSIHTRQQSPLDQPLDEKRPLLDDPAVPPYERSKAAAEREVRQAVARGLDVVTIIPTAVIGPFDFKPSYIGKALLLLARGNLPALVSGGYDWVDVRDVVYGAMQAARLAPAGSSYILSGHWLSIPEVAGQVDRITGRRLARPVVPLKVADWAAPLMLHVGRLNGSQPLYTRAMLTALTSNRMISSAKARQELGYTVRPFQQTLEDTLQWLLEYHHSPKPIHS